MQKWGLEIIRMSSPRDTNYINEFFDYGINTKDRIIYLGSIATVDFEDDGDEAGINWNLARRFLKSLQILDSISDKPIKVIMNSCGGSVTYGMAIYDAIEASRSHITIVNMSQASSMTSIIYQAGDERITAPNSHYMIHDGSFGCESTPSTVKAWLDYEIKVCLPKMYEIYLNRIKATDTQGNFLVNSDKACDILNSKLPSGSARINKTKGIKSLTMAHMKQLCSRDCIFTAQEMVDLNLADRLLKTGDLGK